MKDFLKILFKIKSSKIYTPKKIGFQTVYIVNSAPPPPVIKRKKDK